MSNCVFLFSVSVNLCLLCSAVGVVRSPAMTTVEGRERGFVNLNDMFHEVEELMEDTQHILEDAVDQITAESAKSLENHHSHHSDKIVKAITIHTDKRMNNTAGEPSHIHAAISDERNSVYHVPFGIYVFTRLDYKRATIHVTNGSCICLGHIKECVVDEDCGELKYCLYGIDTSKCLPCIPTDMPCRKNEECCSSQMCVWGQCTVNATEGTEGTICQGQNDCKLDLCCAFQRELLFPVCNPKPRKGEACLNQPNLLMDMLAWDQGVPRDYCPCTNDLECQSHGRGSVCGE